MDSVSEAEIHERHFVFPSRRSDEEQSGVKWLGERSGMLGEGLQLLLLLFILPSTPGANDCCFDLRTASVSHQVSKG